MPPGFAARDNCSVGDVDECASGLTRLCGAGADCINRAPAAFGDAGFECACPAGEFGSAAQTCEPQGIEVRCEARSGAPAAPGAAERLLLAIAGALLDPATGLAVAGPDNDAGLWRAQAAHAVRVSSRVEPSAPAGVFLFVLRIADSMVAWALSARAAGCVERAIAETGGWALLPPGVQTSSRDSAVLAAPSSAFRLAAPPRAEPLRVALELEVAPAGASVAPLLYLAANGTRPLPWDFCPFGGRGCAAAVAAVHAVARGPAPLTGPFWPDSNASYASVAANSSSRPGEARVRVVLALRDLTAHNFTALGAGGVLSAAFFVGVVFVKTGPGGQTLHVEDVREHVRADFALATTFAATYASQSTLEVPLEIALFRVFDAARGGYNDSAQVALFVGAATAEAMAEHPVFFASSLRFGVGLEPHGLALAQACAPAPMAGVAVRAELACARLQTPCVAERVPGRAGWIAFAMPLPGELLSGVAASYDVFGAALYSLVLEFTVEVRDPQTGGGLKDTRLVSKTIQRADVQVLCAAEPPAGAEAGPVALSVVAGLLPANATRFDAVRSGDELSSGRARAMTSLLVLGAPAAFQTPARMHDSVTAHTIVALHFSSNAKKTRALQLLRVGAAFEPAAAPGALVPTPALLRVCPGPAAADASAGCSTRLHARARVLDFWDNSAHQMRSLRAPRGAREEAGALAAWVRAGEPQRALEPEAVFNHSRAAGAEYAVNARFRQGYLLAPQAAPAQFVVTVSTWCVHAPAARAEPLGAVLVGAACYLPVRGASFLDEPYWGETYASAFRELLGLFPREAWANSSGAERSANATRFVVCIVLPHAEPADAREQGARLAAVLDDPASGFALRLQDLLASKFRAHFPDAAALAPPAPLAATYLRPREAPPGAGRVACGGPHVATQAYADTNNADNTALELASASPGAALGRVLQLSAELLADEYCAAASEAGVFALLQARFAGLFVAASAGTIAGVQPTAAVLVTDFACPATAGGARRLLAEAPLRLLVEMVLTPTSARAPMVITASEDLYAAGVRSVFVEPSALPAEMLASLSPVGQWAFERDGTFRAVAPEPLAARPPPAAATRAPAATPAPAPAPTPAPRADTRELLLVNLCCTALSALYACALALAVAFSPRATLA